ncbi:MAG: hypothetical protein PHF38_01590 [Bacteroidales bacterium]|nr:hypothetical protein [Bacteroidales bacterium]
MSPETLSNWIESPESMDRHSQNDLKMLLRNYPCFAGAQVLLLKTMEQERDLNFSEELFKTSLMVPDRKALYYFIKALPYPVDAEKVSDQADFGLIDQFLKEKADDGEQLQAEMPDYFQLIAQQSAHTNKPAEQSNQQSGAVSTETEKQRDQDLIDSFLCRPEEPIQVDKTYEEQAPENSLSDEYPESSFTETLAKIYLKQGKYEKALEIFNILLLKYPEKSIYFADQIRFLNKLIHHLKNN